MRSQDEIDIIEAKFSEAQQWVMDDFKEKLSRVIRDGLDNVYRDVTQHAVTDSHINYRNLFRPQIASEFQREIASKYGHYSWAHQMRMELLKNHKDEIQNKIIEDLQAEIESLKEHVEYLGRWRI